METDARTFTYQVYELPPAEQIELCDRACTLIFPFTEQVANEKDVDPISVLLMTIGALTYQLALHGLEPMNVLEVIQGAYNSAADKVESRRAN